RVEDDNEFMRALGSDAERFRMVEGRNEPEVSTGAGHVNVAARLIVLGFERELVAVFLIDVVFAKIIDGLAQVFHSMVRTAAGVGFSAFASAPEDEDFGTQFRAEIHGAHGFLNGVSANVAVVRSESAIPKHGIEKEIDRRHRDHDAVRLAGRLEFTNNAVAI